MRRSALLVTALFLAACDQPPAKEIAAAEAALVQARKADAEKLAPERYREAEAALQEARSKVQSKDYRGALSSANDASEKARTAAKAASSALTMAKGAVEVAEAEIQAKLDEVAAVRQEAAEAKVPDEAFADVSADQDALRQKADGLPAAASQDLMAAQKTAEELKAQAETLPGRFREALEKWQAEHPKRGKPARKK